MTNFKRAIWSEYSPQIISALNLKKVTQGEYHGSCPNCGGKDRFWINEYNGEVKVQCRQCDDFKEITNILRSQGLWPERKNGFTAKEIEWPSVSTQHPYLAKKKIAQHNALIDGGNLVIPINNHMGRKVGTQTITSEGNKKFSKAMPVIGNFSVLGGTITDIAYIAEGWATAASISEATGKPTVFALNANNITEVITNLKIAKPHAEFIVCADNDEAGIKGAEKAKEDHGTK